MGKNGRKSCRRWLLPAALVLAGAAWFENFTLSSSTVEVRSAALPAAFSGLPGGLRAAGREDESRSQRRKESFFHIVFWFV